MPRFPTYVIIVLSAVSACELPRRLYVDLIVDRTAYVAGDTIRVDLVNSSPETIEFGACSTVLERQMALGWEQVTPPRLPCIAILYTLQAGKSRRSVFILDRAMPSGVYRLRHYYTPAGSMKNTSTVSASVGVTSSIDESLQ
jgi:hypothetical protein